MNDKKYLSMLGMARRAGKLSMGHDTAMKSLKSKKAQLIVFASDISPRLVEEFDRASNRFCPDIACIMVDETINELYKALGYKAGVISVNDKNFSNRINELINSKQEGNVYGNKS